MDNHNIEVASQAEDKQIVASSPCTEFTVFPNLPQELKDRIWKFASPDSNPLVIVVDCDGFTGRRLTERVNNNTIRDIVEKHFNPSFRSINHSAFDYGMLCACRASRHAIIKRLPLRLKSSIASQEVRLGPQDILGFISYDSLVEFDKTRQHELHIPAAIKEIRNLAFLLDGTPRPSLGDFILSILDGARSNPPRDFFAGYEYLEKIILLCVKNKGHRITSLESFTTGFEPQLLSKTQRFIATAAVTSKNILLTARDLWKDHEDNCKSKIPQDDVMARGFPTKLVGN